MYICTISTTRILPFHVLYILNNTSCPFWSRYIYEARDAINQALFLFIQLNIQSYIAIYTVHIYILYSDDDDSHRTTKFSIHITMGGGTNKSAATHTRYISREQRICEIQSEIECKIYKKKKKTPSTIRDATPQLKQLSAMCTHKKKL